MTSGLSQPALHEFYAASSRDGAALPGLGLGVVGSRPVARPVLWIRPRGQERETGAPYPPGLAAFGVDPARIILADVRDGTGALQAALEGARCGALAGVLIELWGEARAYDLTASRRLALAARASGIPVLMLRAAARPGASAAHTRWLVSPARSRAGPANAPGFPVFDLVLLRSRDGRQGLCYRAEWNCDVRQLHTQPLPAATRSDTAPDRLMPAGAPLSGVVVPVSFHRQDPAPAAGHRERKTG